MPLDLSLNCETATRQRDPRPHHCTGGPCQCTCHHVPIPDGFVEAARAALAEKRTATRESQQ